MAKWYYTKDGVEYGPVPTHELKKPARSGQISETDRIKKDGMEKWARAKNVQGLFQIDAPKPEGRTLPPVPPVANMPETAKPPKGKK